MEAGVVLTDPAGGNRSLVGAVTVGHPDVIIVDVGNESTIGGEGMGALISRAVDYRLRIVTIGFHPVDVPSIGL